MGASPSDTFLHVSKWYSDFNGLVVACLVVHCGQSHLGSDSTSISTTNPIDRQSDASGLDSIQLLPHYSVQKLYIALSLGMNSSIGHCIVKPSGFESRAQDAAAVISQAISQNLYLLS